MPFPVERDFCAIKKREKTLNLGYSPLINVFSLFYILGINKSPKVYTFGLT